MARKKDLYTGSIKKIDKARSFAHDTFVYGLKEKNDYVNMSPRSYDKHVRQMKDWFQQCFQTRIIKVRTKVNYISLNSRNYSLNPFYKMWKVCSFTSGQIVFFFTLLDTLCRNPKGVSLSDIVNDYYFIHPYGFGEDNIQVWIHDKGFPSGIIKKSEDNKYILANRINLSSIEDLLYFYSEVAPCGVIGSFILDKESFNNSPFSFKQHYFGQAFDSEIICNILSAIKDGDLISFSYVTKKKNQSHERVCPLKIYSSTQNGRQYLIGWNDSKKCFSNYRIESINNISIECDHINDYDTILNDFNTLKSHIWGVSFGNGTLTHVEFSIRVGPEEAYIARRLEREKRCGEVLPRKNCKGIIDFKADVFDVNEMIPWIRTFICRIVSIHISDLELEKEFFESLRQMYELYSVGGNNED